MLIMNIFIKYKHKANNKPNLSDNSIHNAKPIATPKNNFSPMMSGVSFLL